MWTPFCPNRPGFSHEAHCNSEAACSYCGKANPSTLKSSIISSINDEIIVIEDSPSPPALTPSLSATILDPGPPQRARQLAIQETQKVQQMTPNAGTPIQRTSPIKEPAIKPELNQLSSLRKSYKILIHIWKCEYNDAKLQTHYNWESIRKIQNEIYSDFTGKDGAVMLTPDVWMLDLEKLLSSFKKAPSSTSTTTIIHICLVNYDESNHPIKQPSEPKNIKVKSPDIKVKEENISVSVIKRERALSVDLPILNLIK
ncbi:hypothetical protein GX48_06114 [Paracoccidioides brasiliensis]|nr:hypothetical protein GX48_06114 [Paracoccidioides brasiliensis]